MFMKICHQAPFVFGYNGQRRVHAMVFCLPSESWMQWEEAAAWLRCKINGLRAAVCLQGKTCGHTKASINQSSRKIRVPCFKMMTEIRSGKMWSHEQQTTNNHQMDPESAPYLRTELRISNKRLGVGFEWEICAWGVCCSWKGPKFGSYLCAKFIKCFMPRFFLNKDDNLLLIVDSYLTSKNSNYLSPTIFLCFIILIKTRARN